MTEIYLHIVARMATDTHRCQNPKKRWKQAAAAEGNAEAAAAAAEAEQVCSLYSIFT